MVVSIKSHFALKTSLYSISLFPLSQASRSFSQRSLLYFLILKITGIRSSRDANLVMSVLWSFLSNSFCIPTPELTSANLSNQHGKVTLITGAYAGVGFQLAKILYEHDATVWLAGRNTEKGHEAIEALQAAYPRSKGTLYFLRLDLSDLATIKPAVSCFLESNRSGRLDVLVNNAGVMAPPADQSSAQGHELQMATNCLGPYLLTKLLQPTLRQTAVAAPHGSVRVLWAASLGVDVLSPPGGITCDDTHIYSPDPSTAMRNYAASKAGNVFLANQLSRRPEYQNVHHLSFNPGNLLTELQRHGNRVLLAFLRWSMLYPSQFGAYTELYAGWSGEAGQKERNGKFVRPWGRFGPLRKDVEKEMGEGGKAELFLAYCEETTLGFA